MVIESIKKIVDFLEEEIKVEEISLTLSLHPLAHKSLQKEIWEMGNKSNPFEYTDEFNLQMNKIKFTFLIKE
tara:strand:- start:876 stop:1091 length:216 start_codon:yes stop_codon:yes gene_type:complete